MNKVFEKIIKKQEELFQDLNVIEVLSHVDFDSTIQNGLENFLKAITNEAIEIVKQEAEQYNNGWIPCSDRLPSGLDFVLYTHKDGEVDICSIEYFYDYLDKFTAWQPLPEPFQKGDNNENS